MQVVDRDSAVMGLMNERAVGIAGADHRNTCKFDKEDSQKYIQVWRAIRGFVEIQLKALDPGISMLY